MSTRRTSRQAARRRRSTARNHAQNSLYRRRLRFEPLEDRRLLALVTVTTLADSINFNDGLTSLREAIFATNLVTGPDTIDFAPALTASGSATILLTQGELDITDDLTINGPGANLLTIDASGSDPTPDQNNGDGSRVFHIDDGQRAGFIDVRMSNMSITGGDVDETGGGIESLEYLSVMNVRITGNAASAGGGIYSFLGTLRVANSVIDNNIAWAIVAAAGGIYVNRADANIVGSTIGNNVAQDAGGGIAVTNGSATITETTITANVSYGNGGAGIELVRATVTVANSTISGNVTSGNGGGIFAYRSNVNVDSSTISGNTGGAGGGISHVAAGQLTISHTTITNNTSLDSINGGSGILTLFDVVAFLDHTIVAGNHDLRADAPDIVGIFNSRYSLISSGADFLGPLADNGGPTLTHALLPGSPAINAGDLNAVAGAGGVPLYDQRGEPFSRVFNGRIDIGAFEYQQPSDLNLLVDTFADESDGDYSRGDLSLREAITLANVWSSTDTIRFDPALTASGPATILLTMGGLAITDDVSIFGPGAELLTIDASGNDPTPTIDDGRGSRIYNIGHSLVVSIRGQTLTGGDSNLRGGAIFNKVANLTLHDTVITGNATREFGGGIYASNGTVVIESTTASNNIATGQGGPGRGGGGLFIRSANLTIRESTISGNLTHVGGGLYFVSYFRPTENQLVIANSTISGNQAFGDGGGIWARLNGGTMSLTDSVIEDNVAGQLQPAAGRGGGIFADLTNVSTTVSGATIRNNTALAGGGAYFRAISSDLIVANTQLTSNRAIGLKGSGGGLHVLGRDLSTTIVRNSTVNGNSTFASGGGIFADGVPLTLDSSTVSGNLAGMNGGGILHISAPLHVLHSTITGNTVGRSGGGGGIHVSAGPSFDAFVEHSIVAGNYVFLVAPSDVLRPSTAASLSVHFSLIGHNAGSGLAETPSGMPDANGNRIGGPMHGVIDPLLGPLADNGGPTMTHALLPGSPAINAGDPAAMTGVDSVPVRDQRGAPFTRVYGGRIDIGAFELQPTDYVLGDFNRDGLVDMADFIIWRMQMGSSVSPGTGADANGDGFVDDADLAIWQRNFMQTTEKRGAASRSVVGQLRVNSARLSTPIMQADAERADRALIAWLASRVTSDETGRRPAARRSADYHASDLGEASLEFTAALDSVFTAFGRPALPAQ